MAWVAVAVGGASILGGYMQSQAAGQAAGASAASSAEGIAEQRRQFEAMRQSMAPYMNVGAEALGGVRALSGLGGAKAEQAAISQIAGSPLFQASVNQGEEALLQRAAATGGLRGGNTQAALAQFRPAMLSKAIEDQYARFGGLATMGQNAAAGVGTAGLNTGSNIATLLGQQGAAQAGGIIGQAAGYQQMFNAPSAALGAYTAYKKVL